jgi:predicted nucleotidyltransferase
MIDNKKLNEVVNKIALNYQPESIYLFGSYAFGNPDEDSDLDLIIIKNTDTPELKRGWEVRKFLIGSLVPMDLLIYTPKEFEEELKSNHSFISSVIKKSKLIYERKG